MVTSPVDTHRFLKITSPLEADLICKSLVGQEELGRIFSYRLDLRSTNPNISFDDIVGQRVTVSMELQKGQRYFDGFVASFRFTETTGKFASYQAELRPWLWFLTRTADCRVFQNQTVPDIIKAVFRDNGMSDFTDRLSETYREWEYCVQYRETDFNFVSRLMEQEGIYYFFEHVEGKHTLVLADGLGAHKPTPDFETVPYFPPDPNIALRKEDHLDSWLVDQAIMPGKYAITDFNFKKPKVDLISKLTKNRPHAYPLSDHEIFDYPGEYGEIKDGDTLVDIKLQELQAQHERAIGGGSARGMSAGALFTLDEYPRKDQNKQYLIISVAHDIQSDLLETGAGDSNNESYHCQIQVIDKSEPFRSQRITPKTTVQGPQTAIVVGPSHEEIYCDEHGRVKVQFHWDRYGKKDENSSCWVRVSQLWAGKDWGGIHIPRIGQEVLVSFLEGDPDQPIIIGRVYNAENMPPYELPANKTQSGIKSRSSKEGTGNHFNEFRFEDKKDKEEIYLHAEKNFRVIVENRENRKTYNKRKTVVGDEEDARPTEVIEEVLIEGARQTTIKGNDELVVKEGDTGRTIIVEDGSYELEVQKVDYNLVVTQGHATTSVDMGDIAVEAKAGQISMAAAKSIKLVVGPSSIELTPQGITITGPLLNCEATGINTIKGSLVKIN